MALVCGRDRGPQQGRVQVVRHRIDVNEYGLRAEQRNDLRSGKEAEWASYNLITPADAERHHRQQERIGSAGADDTVLRACPDCKGFFEQADLRPHNVLSVVEDCLNAAID